MEIVEKKVLCVGLCNLDIVMVCKSFPVEDSDQRCLSHRWQRGGNASNNATIFAEFGIPCEVLGTLSLDAGGQFMKKDFEEQNIFIENCRYYKEYESPLSVIWINNENGSRTIVHSNKMPEITFQDFKLLDLRKYSWIHFECRPEYEDKKICVQHIQTWNECVSNDHIKISIEVEKPNLKLTEMLCLGDVVFISKDFAFAHGFTNPVDAVEALYIHLKPGAVLICPWAEKGASAKTSDGHLYSSIAYPPLIVVNTLGAGDTFIAATIMSLMKGKSIEDSIELGCKVAGAKCGMHDTKGLAKICSYL